MTAEQYIWWLHGYLEISGVDHIGPREVKIIKDHINTFFVKKTADIKSLPEALPKSPATTEATTMIYKWPSPFSGTYPSYPEPFNRDRKLCQWERSNFLASC